MFGDILAIILAILFWGMVLWPVWTFLHKNRP